jgi:hypothetical protein
VERYRSTRRGRVRGRRRGRRSLEDVASIELSKKKRDVNAERERCGRFLFDTYKRPSIRDFVLYGTPFLALVWGLDHLLVACSASWTCARPWSNDVYGRREIIALRCHVTMFDVFLPGVTRRIEITVPMW